MICSTDTNPIVTESYLKQVLIDLNAEGIAAAFEMFFLHDLNLYASPKEPMLPEIQDDNQEGFAASDHQPKICKLVKITCGLEDCNLNDYPLRRNPTWASVKRCLLNRPEASVADWHPMNSLHNITQISSIFVMFTSQLWTFIHSSCLEKKVAIKDKGSLDAVMRRWTIDHIRHSIPHAAFEPCNPGFPGLWPGKKDLPFSKQRHIYFPHQASNHIQIQNCMHSWGLVDIYFNSTDLLVLSPEVTKMLKKQ
jgi:hypothetical protein